MSHISICAGEQLAQENVGASVGKAVGVSDGSVVGAFVGAVLGALGHLVGDSLGALVGPYVASSHCSCVFAPQHSIVAEGKMRAHVW